MCIDRNNLIPEEVWVGCVAKPNVDSYTNKVVMTIRKFNSLKITFLLTFWKKKLEFMDKHNETADGKFLGLYPVHLVYFLLADRAIVNSLLTDS